ncbi:MAG TPA: glycoside hydrolase domain-containing protein [Phycisphaerae bacterium]|nr:glycoside hydrolase domain-containing protein [Phycisphaerae bacterium]
MRIDSFRLTARCVGLVLLAAGSARAGLPTEYEEGFVAHEVRIPKLQAPRDPGADLNQAPWTKAAVLTGNLDWRRIRTADLPVTTYLFYDRRALWVGYRCEVKPGAELKAEIKERDQDLKKDDHVTIELDVGPTGRVFYRFVINPLGTLFDSVIIDKTWNSHATVETATDDKGWTAVVGIPFADFNRGEPAEDTAWTINVSTRSGFDNSWAPVLGGYHIPEQFARIVFGGEKTLPARMLEFKPLVAGANALRVQAGPQARYLLEAVDKWNRAAFRQEGTLGRDGRVNFDLLGDRIDHVNFRFTDADGRTILSFWRPAEIPPLLSKLPALRQQADFLRRNLQRFPEPVGTDVSKLLAEVDAFAGTPMESICKEWATLHEKMAKLERQVTDAWLYGLTLERLSPQARFAVALATPMDKVMIKDFPCQGHTADHYDLRMARNEHEAMQVVVIPMTGPLKQVHVAASPAAGKNGQGEFAGKIDVALVGHVQTMNAGSYLPDYVGWYPDPILDFQQTCDAGQGEHVSFWIDVATNKDARPGDYESMLTISAADCPPLKVRLNIHVWDIELPDGTHLRNAFTYTESNTKRLYREKWSSELARRYHDFILDHRLNIDSLYGKEDRDVELLKHGAARGMNAFNLFYVGRGAGVDVVRSLLQERVPALKDADVYKMAYLYGFDEVNDETFPKIKEIFGMVHSLYPDLPRMTTGYDNTFGRTTGLRDYVDIWVPLIPEYNMVEAERLRAEGKDMWWYLCVGPRHPYPNWFVESPAIEARLLMGAMSYKYRVGGVLYFMTNGWKLNDHPISTGPYTDWFPGSGKSRDGVYANGDGSIFCAGPDGPVTTIRYENIRDGLEDYEYLYALAETVESVAAKPATLQRAEFLQNAKELLTVPDRVVESSSRYTDEPSRLYEFRRQAAEAILKGRDLAR